MTWCTHELCAALTPKHSPGMEFQVHCRANSPKGNCCTRGGAEQLWLPPDVCRDGAAIDLAVLGSYSLEKPSVEVVLEELLLWLWSVCPAFLADCPHVLSLLLLLCALRELPWYLQSPKCSAIFVLPAEGHWVPSVPLPSQVNHFASQKSEGGTWEDLLLLDQSEIFPQCLGIGD